ncbi:hypothetical protein DSCO28_31370 [Desulfosarcina ovata subsp. sediminis]|uniref:Uncharacterized protein n=1 Tax=Desulfosarcina ovata subsp. sediminis TaxID=885957 RepID=A0A5K7ZN47_9BACT|nr:hypothetical protein DSCO28_31370 [Desulfosarcina ovata subsp. sediminis]
MKSSKRLAESRRAGAKTGFAVPVDPDAWRRFDPQFVYGCHLNQMAWALVAGITGEETKKEKP